MREYFRHEVLVEALYIGMSEETFWRSTPNKLQPYVKAYNKRRRDSLDEQNRMNYYLGMYFVEALSSTVGNMFSKKGSKQHEYPSEPFEIFKKEEVINIEEKKEEEKAKAISFFNRLAANNGKRVKEV